MKVYCFLHLYYRRFTDSLLAHVDNIPNLENLFVNIPINQIPRRDGKEPAPLKQTVEKIVNKVPSTGFYNFDNTGRDPGGYCRLTKATSNIIEPNDVVFCLQTKACNLHVLGDMWRDRLLSPILGNKQRATKTVKLFEDQEVGLVGSGYERRNIYGPQNKKNYEMICNRLNISEEHRYGDFVAGTMFAARYSVLSELFSVVEESDFSEKDNSSGDGRVPHALERMFTTTARHLNKKVIYVKE